MPLAAPLWDHVQLGGVTLLRAAPDPRTQAQDGETNRGIRPIRSLGQQDDRLVAAVHELRHALGHFGRRWRGLVVLAVEVVQQLPDRGRVVARRAPDDGQARVPTASKYSSSKRASPSVPRSYSSRKSSSAASNSLSRPSLAALARATIVGP